GAGPRAGRPGPVDPAVRPAPHAAGEGPGPDGGTAPVAARRVSGRSGGCAARVPPPAPAGRRAPGADRPSQGPGPYGGQSPDGPRAPGCRVGRGERGPSAENGNDAGERPRAGGSAPPNGPAAWPQGVSRTGRQDGLGRPARAGCGPGSTGGTAGGRG